MLRPMARLAALVALSWCLVGGVCAHETHEHQPHGCTTHRMQLLRQALRTVGRMHPQEYVALGNQVTAIDGSSARRLTTKGEGLLTLESTQPLRIHTDYSALNESTALPYSVCFRVGQWFRWNSPKAASPPASATAAGAEICDRARPASEQNCWGLCKEEDTLTEDMRDYMIRTIDIVTSQMGSLLRVRKRAGNLKLSRDKGEFHQHSSVYNGNTNTMCAKDAQLMYRLPIKPEYCSIGGHLG